MTGCDKLNQVNSVKAPVYGILCDGSGFMFFQFIGKTEHTQSHSFSVGAFPGSSHQGGLGLPIYEITHGDARAFILSMRPICETVFHLLITTYISSLKACRQTLLGGPWTLPLWNGAIRIAEDLLEWSHVAEQLRQWKAITQANVVTNHVVKALDSR